MKHVKRVYGFAFTIVIIIQNAVSHWDDPMTADNSIGGNNNKYAYDVLDEFESESWADQARLDKKYKAWRSCLASDKVRDECDRLYESILRQERPLERVKHYHALTEEIPELHKHCINSGQSDKKCSLERRRRDTSIVYMERELHPWIDIHKMCAAVLPLKKCHQIFEELMIARYRYLQPESLITLAKAHICLDLGRSEEDCEAEANEHYEQVVAKKDEL